jgi:uncharacterized protein (TIGR03083 family)
VTLHAIDPDAAFERAIARAARVIADPAVATRWGEPGILPRMTVGALAGHLLAVVRTFERRCEMPIPRTATVVDPAAGYAQVRLDGEADLDEPGFRSVRDGAARVAERGPEAVLEAFRDCTTRLVYRLRADPPAFVPLPDPTLVCTLRDYTITRVVEVVIHTDDLAVSTGVHVDPPDREAASLVIEFLVSATRHRIGDAQVLRALAGRSDADDLRAL